MHRFACKSNHSICVFVKCFNVQSTQKLIELRQTLTRARNPVKTKYAIRLAPTRAWYSVPLGSVLAVAGRQADTATGPALVRDTCAGIVRMRCSQTRSKVFPKTRLLAISDGRRARVSGRTGGFASWWMRCSCCSWTPPACNRPSWSFRTAGLKAGRFCRRLTRPSRGGRYRRRG